jgi:hypothetical protein
MELLVRELTKLELQKKAATRSLLAARAEDVSVASQVAREDLQEGRVFDGNDRELRERVPVSAS